MAPAGLPVSFSPGTTSGRLTGRELGSARQESERLRTTLGAAPGDRQVGGSPDLQLTLMCSLQHRDTADALWSAPVACASLSHQSEVTSGDASELG